jgi:flavin-dependent dehydrogenase
VAARTAAMRGLDVVVLEAKPEPGARVATRHPGQGGGSPPHTPQKPQ